MRLWDEKMREWDSVFNPFNSLKVLAWRESFEEIMANHIPSPVSVTVDSTNVCNLNCEFCHYAEFRKEKQKSIPEEDLRWLADVLPEMGVRSVCYSGGGEPFVHPFAGKFLRLLKDNKLAVGTITNGVLINNFLDDILYSCRWIGVSIDAGFVSTYEKLKGGKSGDFYQVIQNLKDLVEKRKDDRSPSIGFKFLIHPWNYAELYQAVQLAHEIGVDDFHARPCYNPGLRWEPEMIDVALQQIQESQDFFGNDKFHVYGITHKFDNDFKKKVIKKCEITPIAGLTFAADGYCYVCCDLRGVKMGRLCKWHDIQKVWGSAKHKRVLKNINPSKCPHRCTYAPYQEILDKVFREDKMTYRFP